MAQIQYLEVQMPLVKELLVTFNKEAAENPLKALQQVQTRLMQDPTFLVQYPQPFIGRFYYPVCHEFEVGTGLASGSLSATRLPLDFYSLAERIDRLEKPNLQPITEDIEEEVTQIPTRVYERGYHLPKISYEEEVKQREERFGRYERRSQRLWRLLGGSGLSPNTRYGRESIIESEYDFDYLPFEDDAQIVDEILYERILKRYEGEAEVGLGADLLEFVDLDRDLVSREFIGNKWLTVVTYYT